MRETKVVFLAGFLAAVLRPLSANERIQTSLFLSLSLWHPVHLPLRAKGESQKTAEGLQQFSQMQLRGRVASQS